MSSFLPKLLSMGAGLPLELCTHFLKKGLLYQRYIFSLKGGQASYSFNNYIIR